MRATMRARTRSWVAGALFALGAAAVVGPGCSGSKGQIMFVFQTDMSLPKDIDAIRLLVTLEGTVIFDDRYEKLGSEEGIRLPATLGFLTPGDPSKAIHLRVIATQGGDDKVRVLREVITTVPEDRTAMLQVPIHFLCFGSGEAVRDEKGNVVRENGVVKVKSSCEDGKTCIAGSCADPVVPSEALPEYAAAQVFGGGQGDGSGLCFDTVKCFAEGASAELDVESYAADPTVCRAAVPVGGADINVALLTQGGGICGDQACYVPMDAGSDAGWRSEEGGWITLPRAVCEKVVDGKLLGLTFAPASEGTCQKKGAGLPTCGAWSASGEGQYTAPDKDQPLPLALGLRRPVSLAVVLPRPEDEEPPPEVDETPWLAGVYWTEASTFDEQGTPKEDGAVRMVPIGGSNPLAVAEGLRAPREIVVDNEAGVVLWTSAGAGAEDGAIMFSVPETEEARTLLTGRRQPEGIARVGSTLYWTELWGSEIFQVNTVGQKLDVAVPQGEAPVSLTGSAPLGASPYRVVAAQDVVCWTYQGELQSSGGAVVCRRGTDPAQVIAEQQSTPRAIALDGDAQAVYWASFEGGTISRADLGDGSVTVVAEGQALPSGVAVDEGAVYWTNRGDGTVMRALKAGGAPEEVAKSQLRPGAIAVNERGVYWINEGSADLPADSVVGDGAVMWIPKEGAAE